jgi:hypothetical protein
MSPELDSKLCEKYPKIFVNRYADMQTTAMCWGFECGGGWYNIIDALCANIQGYITRTNDWRERLLKDNLYNNKIPDELPQVVAVQVKEKFGGLRFYVDRSDSAVDALISMAESMSYRTCEVCGSPGKSRNGGWIRTLCDTHAAEQGYDQDAETE